MCSIFFFFFNDTSTTETYTLSLHDALPISVGAARLGAQQHAHQFELSAFGSFTRYDRAFNLDNQMGGGARLDRKSTRLNSSHTVISYAVFCLKKKKHKKRP